MLEFITQINAAVNNFVWGVIIGVGLYLSVRTGFLQFRKFGYSIKMTLGRLFHKKEAAEGSITPFQAVCTALAATVGTGNIAGVATALVAGGPGALVWMELSALLGLWLGWGGMGVAVGMSIDLVLRGAVFLWRQRSRKWTKFKVI